MMVLNILCFLWANILFYPAMEMVPLCLGAVHVRGVMVGETRYVQAQCSRAQCLVILSFSGWKNPKAQLPFTSFRYLVRKVKVDAG